MTSPILTNLFYSEKDIGATLKMSKRQFIWEFDLNGSSQRLELLDSRLSRKKRLFKNGVSILDTTETGNFIHNFEIDGHSCVIIQYGDKIELRIDNQSFTHLYNLQKNKQLFAGEKGPTSSTYVAKPFNTNSSNENKHAEDAFYKINKPEEENKPKLFNFEIKKDTGNKNTGGFNKFKFGVKNDISSNNNSNQINLNNNNKKNNNNENVDLLGFQDDKNTKNNDNINNNNNNNNLLNFGNDNNNVQNQSNNGNDIFNLIGNNIQNQQNNSNNNNNNQLNNIFLQLTDGTNQQPKFDQNNLGFLDLSNNNNNNYNFNNNNSNNNMNNQGQQKLNQNNVQNKGTNDLFQF